MSTCKVDVSSWEPKQVEMQYFFPLTEQIPLNLDYIASENYLFLKRNREGWSTTLSCNGITGNTTWLQSNTIQFRPTDDSAGYWKVGEGLQMHNKNKPSWLHQQMTKIFFGWKWMNK